MNVDQIREFLKDNRDNLKLFATQRKISGPKILRNLEKLANGEIPPPINVVDDLIIEGHHRYIAGNIFGSLPDMQPGAKPGSIDKIDWGNVAVDVLDWDNP